MRTALFWKHPSKLTIIGEAFNLSKTHMTLKTLVSLNQDPLVQGFRPSIDVTMKSVANVYGENAVGVILTGMGEDGARGMKTIKRKNGRTIAQDETTSMIFGMPKRVIEEGDADYVLPLFEISQRMIQMLQER